MDQKRYNPFAEIVDLLVLMLTLLAPALGGSTLPWQQGALVLAGAGLILLSPPTRFLPRGVTILLALVLLFACAPFLPASLAPDPWREKLAGIFQISLPSTIATQPWLTLEGVTLLFAGLVWGAFLLTRRWELSRETALEVFAGGLFLLTLGAIVVYFLRLDFPLWRVEAGAFGFFPHRNQTATLLGLGGVVTLALFARRLHQRNWLALLWAASYSLIAVGLVINYSRAGILIFFFGSLAWLVCSSHWARNYFALGMGLTCLFTMVALFVLFGGETWERFRPKQTGTAAAPVLDYRVLVQKDSLGMAKLSSWHGLGFGNLEPALQQHRVLSSGENRLDHPDSDWLWLALELGFPGTFLLLAAILWLLVPCWPFPVKSQRRLRLVCLLCVIFFILHGFVDVSGHRYGTVWPLLFLCAMARPRDGAPPLEPAAPWIFRGLALLVAAIGGAWLVASFSEFALPTSGRLAELNDRARLAMERRDPAVAVAALTEALEISPLDYRLYFARATAHLARPDGRNAAILDFQRARHLEPHASKLLLEEGKLWLALDRDHAIEAWAESIRRAGVEAQDRFQLMLLSADKDPYLRQALWVITGSDPYLKMMFLRHSQGDEFRVVLDTWLRDQKPFHAATPAQLHELFALWFERGDRLALETYLSTHSDARQIGGRWLAEIAAQRRDFKIACELALKSTPEPAMPARRRYAPLSELQADYAGAAGGRRMTAGITLALAQLDAQKPDDALATLTQVAEFPSCPRYVFFLQTRTLAQKARWEEAWTSWKKYTALTK